MRALDKETPCYCLSYGKTLGDSFLGYLMWESSKFECSATSSLRANSLPFGFSFPQSLVLVHNGLIPDDHASLPNLTTVCDTKSSYWISHYSLDDVMSICTACRTSETMGCVLRVLGISSGTQASA